MRVLMISWEYPPHMVGGMGRHVADLAPQLTAQGIELHVLTPGTYDAPPYELISANLHIHRIPLPPSSYDIVTQINSASALFLRVAQQMWRAHDGFDLIHVHDWLLADVAITLKHHFKRPLIATIHAIERGRRRGHIQTPESQYIDACEWRLGYEAWRVVVCSQYMVNQLHHEFMLPIDKIDMVPNGVVVPPYPFADAQSRALFRTKYQPHAAPLLFAVGRLVHEKGWHVLMHAVRDLVHDYPQLRLVLAGVGGYQQALHQVVNEHNLHETVVFAGFISDKERNALYATADVAVFPSLYEPFGIVALEAMALRCPVVVSDTGGLREVVESHRTGLLVYPDDVESLTWGLHHTLTHQQATQDRVNAAYEEVRMVFGWQTIAAATAAIYGRVVSEWQRGSWGTHD
jgi:glycogen(starch) synthase